MSTVPTARRARSSLRARAAAVVTRSGGETRRRPALAFLVTALVLGILGMHALASHVTPATSAPSPDMSSMVGMTRGMAASVADQVDDSSRANASNADAAGLQTGHGSAKGPDHGSGDAMSMLMLCAVMLSAATFTLLALLGVGMVRPLLPAAFHPAVVRARALQWLRGAGPPPEWQFSVIRC